VVVADIHRHDHLALQGTLRRSASRGAAIGAVCTGTYVPWSARWSWRWMSSPPQTMSMSSPCASSNRPVTLTSRLANRAAGRELYRYGLWSADGTTCEASNGVEVKVLPHGSRAAAARSPR
jgi:transcriptional regulator GlxA family with amidase domain